MKNKVIVINNSARLLDHICVIIEQQLEKEEDFEQCYEATIRAFYRQELREIEEETIFQIFVRISISACLI